MAKHHLWAGCMVALCALAATGIAADKEKSKKADNKVAEKVDVPQEAVAVLLSTQGNRVNGIIMLKQKEEGVHVTGTVRGLKPGKRGFHIHEFGDLRSPDGKAAGGHFNPKGVKHGGPDDEHRHAGDLGNITADSNGTAKVDTMAEGLKLHFVIGRSIVVHGGEDDLKSQPSGDAGPRVAVGVIGYAGPSQEKSKTAAE